MDAREWLGLEATHNPMRWVLPVKPGICAGGSFLFGGCGLGGAISAMEGSTDRPVVWATGQYVDYAPAGSVVDFDVTVAKAGKHVTQARTVGHVADREILTVHAALGERPRDEAGSWAVRPNVAPPAECPVREHRHRHTESINDRIETRIAAGSQANTRDGRPSPDGRSVLWARMPEMLATSGAGLAILGDFVPGGIGHALGRDAGGNSLDNTLRVVRIVPTEWVLLDIHIDGIHHGFGHGTVNLWAEDGPLLATAGQSTIVRIHDEP